VWRVLHSVNSEVESATNSTSPSQVRMIIACIHICITYDTSTLKERRKGFIEMVRTGSHKSNDFGDDDSIANSAVTGNYNSGGYRKGFRDLLTEEMFLQDRESELLVSADAEKIRTLALSTLAPAILVGWKVLYGCILFLYIPHNFQLLFSLK
jgi:hypothetical protein